MEVLVASTADIKPGQMIGIEREDKSILIANVDGIYYAIDDICTHRGCNISTGVLKGDQAICPCHGTIYDVKTGAVVKGPAKKPVYSYPLKVEGSEISVTV